MDENSIANLSVKDEQIALEQAWEAVPSEEGNKGCVFDVNKESLGVLAITDDGLLILKRQPNEDFVVVTKQETMGWRVSPFNEAKEVKFQWVSELLG